MNEVAHNQMTRNGARVEEEAIEVMIAAEELWNAMRRFNAARNGLSPEPVPPTPIAIARARRQKQLADVA